MKNTLFILCLFASNYCFSQARELNGRDTTTKFPVIYKDTLATLQADSPIVATKVSPYLLKLSLSSGFAGGYWTKNTLYPTKLYVGAGSNTYTNVGIGTDTAYSQLQIQKAISANAIDTSSGILLSNPNAATSGNQMYSPQIMFQGNGWHTTTPGSSKQQIREYLAPVQSTVFPLPSLNWDVRNSDNTWFNLMKLQSFSLGGAPWGGITIGNGTTPGAININVTANRIDNDLTGNANDLVLYHNYGSGGVTAQGYTNLIKVNQSGFLSKLVYAAIGTFAVNDFSAVTYGALSAIGDFGSAQRGFLMPRLTTGQRDSIYGSVRTISLISGGTGYSTSNSVSTTTNGLGTGGIIRITSVSGGVITGVATSLSGSIGKNYVVGDTLFLAGGTGGTALVTGTGLYTTTSKGLEVVDSTIMQKSIYSGVANGWSGKVFTTSAATYNLWYGDDYIFTGTTSTFTLPALGNFQGRQNAIVITNLGSGSITISSATGSQVIDIGTVTATSTITLATGTSTMLLPTGTAFKAMYKQ